MKRYSKKPIDAAKAEADAKKAFYTIEIPPNRGFDWVIGNVRFSDGYRTQIPFEGEES
jgi:hypothetical protein